MTYEYAYVIKPALVCEIYHDKIWIAKCRSLGLTGTGISNEGAKEDLMRKAIEKGNKPSKDKRARF